VAAVALAVAPALIVAAVLPLVNRRMHPYRPPEVVQNQHVIAGSVSDSKSAGATVDAPALSRALAEAKAVTWDLALAASEPATRIGRQVWGAVTDPGHRDAAPSSVKGSETVAVSSRDALAPDVAAAGEILRQIGDRVATGARPLSVSARHAFGFLLGPAHANSDAATGPPARKGT
jgi:hypothetical protein